MSENETFIKFKEIYDEIKKQNEYLEKQGFNDEQIKVIGDLVANKEYLLSKYKDRLEKDKKDISHLIDIINHNCTELKTTSDEFMVLKLWQDKLEDKNE